MRGPVGSEPPGFRHAPFMLLLVVESLAPMPRGVKPPVRLPGDCLHERWQLEQNQPFLFQGDGWHLESSRAPPPMPLHTQCLYTRQGHQSPSSHAPSSNDRTTHCPDHPAWPTSWHPHRQPSHQGRSLGWRKGSSRRWNHMKLPFFIS